MTPDRDVERHSLDGAIPAALVAGVPVDDVTTAETVELVDAFVAEGRATGRTFQIATINVDFVVNALADHEVLGVLQRAELCVPDGMPILWHARLAGTPTPRTGRSARTGAASSTTSSSPFESSPTSYAPRGSRPSRPRCSMPSGDFHGSTEPAAFCHASCVAFGNSEKP